MMFAMEKRLVDYFDPVGAFWGDDWLNFPGDGYGVKFRAATEWFVGGFDAYRNLLGNGWYISRKNYVV